MTALVSELFSASWYFASTSATAFSFAFMASLLRRWIYLRNEIYVYDICEISGINWSSLAGAGDRVHVIPVKFGVSDQPIAVILCAARGQSSQRQRQLRRRCPPERSGYP